MPSYRPHWSKKRPWYARRKRNGVDIVLGNFATRIEAEQAEARFDENNPSRRGKGMRIWRNQTGWGYIKEVS